MLMVFDHCILDSKPGGQTPWGNDWQILHHPSLLSFLLALNCVFSKTKMFKVLFVLFVIKQLLGNITSDINIQPSKALSDEGKLSGGNSEGNIA